MFGRVHRTNQAHAPTFLVLVSSVCGEARFASSIAARMQTLGALTRGDRFAAHAGSEALAQFDFQTEEGVQVVNQLMKNMVVTSLLDFGEQLERAMLKEAWAALPPAQQDELRARGGVEGPLQGFQREYAQAAAVAQGDWRAFRHTAEFQLLGQGTNATRERLEQGFINRALPQFQQLQVRQRAHERQQEQDRDMQGGQGGGVPDAGVQELRLKLLRNVAAFRQTRPQYNDTALPWTSRQWSRDVQRHRLSPKPFRQTVWLLLLTRRSAKPEHRGTWGALPKVLFDHILWMVGLYTQLYALLCALL